MDYSLTCPNCDQKRVIQVVTGFTCANCGQSWATIQELIRAHLGDPDQNTRLRGTLPTGSTTATEAVAHSSQSWLERLPSAWAELPLKLLAMLLNFLPRLIFSLVVTLLTVLIKTLLLVLITYPLLLGFHLWFKARGQELSPEKRAALQSTAQWVVGGLVLVLIIGLILAVLLIWF